MFESDFVDLFSRTHWAVVPILFVPPSVAMLWWGVAKAGVGILTSAVSQAFASVEGNQEITITDVVQFLKHPDYDVDRLGLRLVRMIAPYLRGNPLGRYFDGPNGLVIRPGLTVIELKELERTPSLQAVFVMALLHLVTTFFGPEAVSALKPSLG